MCIRAWKCALMEHCQTTYMFLRPRPHAVLLSPYIWCLEHSPKGLSRADIFTLERIMPFWGFILHWVDKSPWPLIYLVFSLFNPAWCSSRIHSFVLSLPHTKRFLSLCFSIFHLAHDPLCSLSDNPALQEVAESECMLLPGEISFLSGQKGDIGSQPKETAQQRNSGGDHIRPWAHAVEIKSSTPSFGHAVSQKGVYISSALLLVFRITF